MKLTRHLGAALSSGALVIAMLLSTARSSALDVELGAQTLATLVSGDDTKGGGVGFGVEGGVVVLRPSPLRSAVLARARLSVLGGAGLAWGLEVGGAWRTELDPLWQPEAGLYLLYLGGDLAHSIDARGELAGNPVGALLGLSPLRLALEPGWVSFLSVPGGLSLGRSGHPPLATSLTLFEVGRTF